MDKKYFELGYEHIGGYIVSKMATHIHFSDDLMSMEWLTHNGKSVHYIYVPAKIGFYNNGSYSFDYKVTLTPIGNYRKFVSERAWYTCDIESRINHNPGEINKYFDDPTDALAYAEELNKKLFNGEID